MHFLGIQLILQQDIGLHSRFSSATSGEVVVFFCIIQRNIPTFLMDCKKNSVVAQSTNEAEFISTKFCEKQFKCLSYLLNDFNLKISKPTILNDNSGVMTISSQASLNSNTKHIEIRYQYVRYLVGKRLMVVKQVGTDDMLADELTKRLGTQKVNSVRKKLHLEHQG
ncbi:hypothetical protein O181_010682 [Austropuccinia psidii MF-1]|uniref:Copia protein n=1 Tax=Austropuccinia psidii MF-1 TaxID=1389203 RepID=A0A9Q3GLF4_9BASI|nr:hypothetical protein [Austropuccinia psidii MF-1]